MALSELGQRRMVCVSALNSLVQGAYVPSRQSRQYVLWARSMIKGRERRGGVGAVGAARLG